jgi:hypothetical protein
VDPEKRRRLEALIRIIDIVIYLFVFAGGIYALLFTPTSVQTELIGYEWLIAIWAALLLIGGALGFVGRLSRYWVLELPATAAAFFGILIYVVVLGRTAFLSITAAVAVALVIVALGLMLRRYIELQIFGTDPGHKDFQTRLADMIRRRTQNVPPRAE